jgi:hypothetical protein
MGMDTNDGLARIARRKCIASLLQGLSKEGIIVYPNGYTDIATMPRGGAYFLRYIPQKTTFDLLAGFPKYFQIARRHDLISRRDAELLVVRLAALGSNLRSDYKGLFLEHLHTGMIGELLDSGADAEALDLLQATEDWFPDLLHEQLRWPCVVDDYLMPREFSYLTLDPSRISKMVNNPIRALVAGAGLVRTGHWLGLSTEDIHNALNLLDASRLGAAVSDDPDMPIKRYAEKIMIPIFSLGFQGAIIGFFSHLEPQQRMHLRCLLDQAGRCLGELQAVERKTKLVAVLRQSKVSAKTLADVALQIASPIEHIVVSLNGEHYGYAICKEEDYLAGYDQKIGIEAEHLKQDPNNEILDLRNLDPPAQIYIKPLRGYAALEPVIYGLRIRTALSEFFGAFKEAIPLSSPLKGSTHTSKLNVEELDKVIMALQQQMNTSHGRRAAAKCLCFFEMVKDRLGAKELRITNADMQRRMSQKLDMSKLNGYQVTGEALRKFSAEINDLLPNRFSFENLSDKVVRVSW